MKYYTLVAGTADKGLIVGRTQTPSLPRTSRTLLFFRRPFMARLRFIKGTITGRLGEFVGSRWKGINYIKTYAAPTNPRTPKQVVVRSIFKMISTLATALFKAGVYNTFPPYRRMTARNAVIRANGELFANNDDDVVPIAIAPSNINPFTTFFIDDVTVGGPGILEFAITNTWAANFTPADFRLHVVAYFFGESTAYYQSFPATAMSSTVNMTVPAGVENETLYCFAYVTYTDANGKKFISEAATKRHN
jgi:hypothetical protein